MQDEPVLNLEPSFVEAAESETVEFVCDVIAGNPWPKIDWFKNELTFLIEFFTFNYNILIKLNFC